MTALPIFRARALIKQADVLLLMTRMPELFSREEKLAAWEDFEPLCIHDSTLSFATHALFAAQNGLSDDAMRYFTKALWLDLRDVMCNTGKEGLHLACLGETYQSLVFGFAGLHLEDGQPVLSPNLPEGWRSLRFRFHFRGARFEARLRSATAAPAPPCFICWGRIKKRPRHYINDKKGGKPL